MGDDDAEKKERFPGFGKGRKCRSGRSAEEGGERRKVVDGEGFVRKHCCCNLFTPGTL